MKTSVLLDKLIDIAQISKTDFALSLHISPSSLSKILTGSRLPNLKEKRTFSRRAAHHLSEAVYGYNCYIKFSAVFPVLYDFSSKYELEIFLTQAIDYSLDKDFTSEISNGPNYAEESVTFHGTQKILNMLCIIISDRLIISEEKNLPLELYTTLSLKKTHADIFRRIKISRFDVKDKPVVHHFSSIHKIDNYFNTYQIDTFFHFIKIQQYADVNYWTTGNPALGAFLMLKNNFLIFFTLQVDGMPFMTFITNKGYIASFYNFLISQGAKKISFSRKEALSALEKNPCFFERLLHKGIDAVYNFISAGNFTQKEDLIRQAGNEKGKALISGIFQNIINGTVPYYVTMDAIIEFYYTGKAIIPFIGVADVPPEDRISRISKYNEKFTYLNCEMPRILLLHSPGMTIAYTIDKEYRYEKIHVFETDSIHNVLSNSIKDNKSNILTFSPELWTAYINELSGRDHPFP